MKVQRLEHSRPEVAEELRALCVASYRVERDLLGLREFPPLQRTAEQLAAARESTYFGIRAPAGDPASGDLVAALELEPGTSAPLHVGTLVVHPRHFRRGLATRLLQHAIQQAGARPLSVSTAHANTPALRLYEGLGFREHERWSTTDDLAMVTLLRPGLSQARDLLDG